jgi:DNA-binding NtrC family response regulator
VKSQDTTSGFRLQALQNVQPLRPIRVLLVGRDARYLRVMAFLLHRRGYETRQLQRAARVPAEVSSFMADVVILDGSESFAEAARQAAELIATTERLGVVVVGEREAPSSTAGLHYVEKWASFDAVSDAVELVWVELSLRSIPERSVPELMRDHPA